MPVHYEENGSGGGGGGLINPIPDNQFIQFGNTSNFDIGNVVQPSGANYGVMTTNTLSNILLFTEDSNKTFDFINLNISTSSPTFVLTSALQNNNTFGIMSVDGAGRTFNFQALGGDDVDGTARNANGMGIGLQAHEGGSLGGNGGSINIEAGGGTFAGTIGGNIELKVGEPGAGGSRGVITPGTVDFRFKNSSVNYFKILSSSSEKAVAFRHDDTNAIYHTTDGVHFFSENVQFSNNFLWDTATNKLKLGNGTFPGTNHSNLEIQQNYDLLTSNYFPFIGNLTLNSTGNTANFAGAINFGLNIQDNNSYTSSLLSVGFFTFNHAGNGTVTAARGILSQSLVGAGGGGGSGTATLVSNFTSRLFKPDNAAHIVAQYGFHALDWAGAGAGTVDTYAAFKIDNPTYGTTRWGLADDATNNYMSGSLAIGTTSAPTVTLDVVGTVKINSVTGQLDLSPISAGNDNIKITPTSATPVTIWTVGVPSNDPNGFIQINNGTGVRYIPYWV